MKIKIPAFVLELDESMLDRVYMDELIEDEVRRIIKSAEFKKKMKPIIREKVMAADFEKLAEKAFIKSMEDLFK